MDTQASRTAADPSSNDEAAGDAESTQKARTILERLRREAQATLLGMERDGLVTFSAEPLFPPLFSLPDPRGGSRSPAPSH